MGLAHTAREAENRERAVGACAAGVPATETPKNSKAAWSPRHQKGVGEWWWPAG
eukprot:COSAG01_NODE_21208_length_913_cov_0.723587_2_plen_53_part_01